MSLARILGLIVALVLFLAGVWLLLWTITDGEYTGLLGVRSQVGVSGRIGFGVLAVVFMAPGAGMGLMDVRRNASRNRPAPVAELTEWEAERKRASGYPRPRNQARPVDDRDATNEEM